VDGAAAVCGRFRRLAARKHTRQVAVVAVARELAGFLWAEMTAEHAQPPAITADVGPVVIVAAMTRRRPAAAGPIPGRSVPPGHAWGGL
jgi:hypothetical protein